MLGIVVVYLFEDDNAGLFDLHVERIARHTRGPYRIYGGVNRLARASLARVLARPEIRPVTCPETALRGGDEHAFYLDHLVEAAFADGVSHVAVMHLDSFPIRDGWDDTLRQLVSGRCACATLAHVDTALLCVAREFYLSSRPRARLAPGEDADPRYRAFVDAHDPQPHSGVGYAFRAFTEGWSVQYLHPAAGQDGPHPYVYGDLVFHLGGATKHRQAPLGTWREWLPEYVAALNRPIAWLRDRVPASRRLWIRERLAGPLAAIVDRPRFVVQRNRVESVLPLLLADPDAFIERHRDASSG